MNKKITTIAFIAVSGLCAFGLLSKIEENNFNLNALLSNEKANKQSLVLNSSLFNSGSGSFIVNGNSFSYSNVSVSGSIITINTNGYIQLNDESGHTSGETLSGSGLTTFEIEPTSYYLGNVRINSSQKRLELTQNVSKSVAINSREFKFTVLSGSISAGEFRLNYECGSNSVNFDGLPNEAMWSSDVLNKPYIVNKDNDYKTEIYMSKRNDGIYIYAEQHVKTIKNINSNWWEHDNIEFRFASTSDVFARFSDKQQYYFSANGLNNFTNYSHSDFTYNSETGLNDISYEAFLNWPTLGYQYSDMIIFTCGTSYYGSSSPNTGKWTPAIGFDSPSSDIYRLKFMAVTERGIDIPFDGDELVNTPIYAEWNGVEKDNWNTNVYTHTMDGSKDWTLYLKIHSKVSNQKASDIGAGFAGEVYSPGWSNGGWTFRKDWCGWGSWHDAYNSYARDIKQVCNDTNWNVDEPIVKSALIDIDVDIVVRHDASRERIIVSGVYHLDQEVYGNKYIIVNYEASTNGWTGDMVVGFGYNFSEFTLNSCKVVREDMKKATIDTGVTNIGDPFIYYEDGYYYMFGTNESNGSMSIKCYKGKGLDNFSEVSTALVPENSYGVSHFWAPEVVKYQGYYYMFYSCKNSSNEMHVTVARSNNVIGPYVDVNNNSPLLSEISIDASPFIDPVSGNVYLLYAKDCSHNTVGGYPTSQIFIIQLNSSLTSTIGSAKLIATPTYSWETIPCDDENTRWNEGPSLLYHDGYYFLTYSAQRYDNAEYCVGCARSTSVMGVYTKHADGPIMKRIPGVTSGPGHCSFFTDRNGDLMCSYHTHINVNYPSDGRKSCYSPVSFENDWLVINYK